MSDSYLCERIEHVFHQLFLHSHNTRIIGGAQEPIYLPAGVGSKGAHQVENDNLVYDRVIYYRDHPRSAFHEIAHWCVAGPARRTKIDYGYWYQPDGRTAEQQAHFERVEIKPQAFEWIFCKAAKLSFCISQDNLNGQSSGTEHTFKGNVLAQVVSYMNNGLPDRADRYTKALCKEFSHDMLLHVGMFSIEELG